MESFVAIALCFLFFSLKPHRFDLFYVILPLKQHNNNVISLTPFTKQQLMPQEEKR
jgi:hypothetical protein